MPQKNVLPIIYEDDMLCIVNKPAGLPVQGGAKIAVCLTDILSHQLNCPIFPVHRLDKETAGILLTAKTADAAHTCREFFDSHRVKKEYIACCFGSCHEGSSGNIALPIREKGIEKPALSTYRCILSRNNYSLFTVTLHTGRMHQIRIHLAANGHPIIGDDRHGNFALNKVLWKNERIKKLHLCAQQLEFPIAGKNRKFTVPLPDYMQNSIDKLLKEKSLFPYKC